MGGLLGGSGGSGSQTASKEPWEAAAPWLKGLLEQGQGLSSYYTQNPFNPGQTAAYGNMANQSAYMRSLVPGLLGQLSGQPLSFNQAAPQARPQAFQFAAGPLGSGTSLLAAGGERPFNPVTSMAPIPVAPPAAPPAAAPSATGPGTGFNWWEYGSAGGGA